MNKVYTEIYQTKMALNRKKFCPQCGEHQYTIVEQIEPITPFPWSVRCRMCGYETDQCAIKKGALALWRLGL